MTAPKPLPAGNARTAFHPGRKERRLPSMTDPGLWHVWPKGFGLT
ncbi:MAG: hypothetical protein ACYDBP_07870 [Leptospirales bacterium]